MGTSECARNLVEQQSRSTKSRHLDQCGTGIVQSFVCNLQLVSYLVPRLGRELDDLESFSLSALRGEQPRAGGRINGERAHETSVVVVGPRDHALHGTPSPAIARTDVSARSY